MREVGFTYIPILAPADYAPSNPNDAGFRKEHGYGLATSRSAPEFVDPNIAVRNKMSAGELERYWLAFFGDDATRTSIVNELGQTFGSAPSTGCVAMSYPEVFGIAGADHAARLDLLERKRNDLARRMKSDPRYVEIWSDWTACMATAGYLAKDRIAAIELVSAGESTDAHPGDLERRVADADNACDLANGTDAALVKLRYSYDRQVLDTFAELMSDINIPAVSD
jgi:hypothetical protein